MPNDAPDLAQAARDLARAEAALAAIGILVSGALLALAEQAKAAGQTQKANRSPHHPR